MKPRLFPCLALILVGALSGQRAHALDFTFAFSNNNYSAGYVPGTVTGIIYGLTDNASSAPTYITITSAPAGLGLTTPDPLTLLYSNGDFTVTHGAITSDNFNGSAYGGVDVTFDAAENRVRNSVPFVDDLQNSFTGAVFSPRSSVPEPSQYGLFVFLAVAGVTGWRRFYRQALSPA